MGQQIEDLAAFVAALRWQDAPAPIQRRVKHALLDTVGVILAGSLRPEVQALRAGLTGSGGTGATLLAPALAATDPRTAALLNATLLVGAGAVIKTPDTPLLFFWGLSLWALARIAAGGTQLGSRNFAAIDDWPRQSRPARPTPTV